jgi:hypothetical protein
MGETKGVVVITGAGGFIGGNLIAALRSGGVQRIRAVDTKPFDERYQRLGDVENLSLDLNLKENCDSVTRDASEVYNLAANMAGMGFIGHNKVLCHCDIQQAVGICSALVRLRLHSGARDRTKKKRGTAS